MTTLAAFRTAFSRSRWRDDAEALELEIRQAAGQQVAPEKMVDEDLKSAATITDAIVNDPETEVKTRAVFALSRLPTDEGVPRLIEVARSHRNPAVRRTAMFWLGQSNDSRALAFFEEVLRK